jgi:hypothetical protein
MHLIGPLIGWCEQIERERLRLNFYVRQCRLLTQLRAAAFSDARLKRQHEARTLPGLSPFSRSGAPMAGSSWVQPAPTCSLQLNGAESSLGAKPLLRARAGRREFDGCVEDDTASHSSQRGLGSPAWGQLASRPAEVVRFVRSGIRYCASGSDREPRIREARSSSTTTPTVKYLCGADQPWTVAGSFMRRDTVEYLLTTNAPSFVLRNHCVVRASV